MMQTKPSDVDPLIFLVRWCLVALVLVPLYGQAGEPFKTSDQLIEELGMTDQQVLLRSTTGRVRLSEPGVMTPGEGQMFPAESAVMGMVTEPQVSDFGRTDLTVEFEYNSSSLTPQARRQLIELAKALGSPQLRDFEFEVVGHTDGVGSEDYNQRLSELRARAVQVYLTDIQGIQATRLLPIGLGEEQLKFPHDPENGANRRVEVINIGRAYGLR